MIPLVTGLLWQNNRFRWTNRPWRLPGSQESAPVPPGSVLWKDLFQYGDTSGNILGLVILNEMLILTDCLDCGSLCARVASGPRGRVVVVSKNHLKGVKEQNFIKKQLHDISSSCVGTLKDINVALAQEERFSETLLLLGQPADVGVTESINKCLKGC